MVAQLLAGVLTVFALAFSLRSYLRCRALVVGARAAEAADLDADTDELERRLAAREQALALGLASRNVQALGRAVLFGGTGVAVWQLSLELGGGSGGAGSSYARAGVAFGLGFVGWAGCGELYRRIGSLAGQRRRLSRRPARRDQDVDPASRTG